MRFTASAWSVSAAADCETSTNARIIRVRCSHFGRRQEGSGDSVFVNATRVTERTFEAVQQAKNAACRLAQQNMMRIVAAITAGKEGHTVDLAVALRSKGIWQQARDIRAVQAASGQFSIVTRGCDVIAVCDGRPDEGAGWKAVGMASGVMAWQEIPHWFPMAELIDALVRHGQLLGTQEVAENGTSQTANQPTAPVEYRLLARGQHDKGAS